MRTGVCGRSAVLSDDALVGARSRLDPAAGVMLSALWVTSTAELVLVIHHLAVDAVSWRILVDDLNAAWGQYRGGGVVALPVRGTSFRRWASVLVEQARSGAVVDQLAAWRRIVAVPGVLPAVEPAVDTLVTAGQTSMVLDTETTRLLLGRVPAAFHAGVQDILLIAFGLAWAEFLGGGGPITIDVEGHGRDEEVAPGIDLSQTVGWFTTKYPVCLMLDRLSWPQVVAGQAALGAAVKGAKEQLRAVPAGYSYGLLRYLNGEVDLDGPDPPIGFNYLGRVGGSPDSSVAGDGWQISSSGGLFTDAAAAGWPMPLMHTVEVNAVTLDTDTGPHLQATWSWASSKFDATRVARLGQLWFDALAGICAHVRHGGGGFTPSDFALTRLTQEQLEDLERAYRIADVLPLTPLQQGLLFHSSYARGSGEGCADSYAVQIDITLAGRLDLDRLHDAVQAVITRHPHLGARFVYHGLDEPVQVILTNPVLPWRYIDLAGDDGANPEDGIEWVCAQERGAVSDLAHASPLRAVLFRTAAERYRLVLTNHHIVLDGWSGQIVVREIVAGYHLEPLPTPAPYRGFLAWLAARDVPAAETAWRTVFAGFESPTLVGPPDRVGRAERGVASFAVPADITEALNRLARSHNTTINTVLQAAWARLVGALTGQHDVAFGTTVSGRPAELAGVESMVGLLINTVPVRAIITATTTTAQLLDQLQTAHTDTLEHQHLALSDIHRVTGHDALFDTLFVYENYPRDTSAPPDAPGLTITDISGREFSHYPLTVLALPGRELGLRVEFATDVFDADSIEALIERFERVVVAMCADPTRRLSSMDLLGEGEHARLDGWGNRAVLTRPAPTPVSIPVVWAAQVARTPEAVALTFEGHSLTYRELDEASSRLAHLLAGLGVGAGDVVGLLLPRSAQAITAIVAVLKTGAAYLPIDPMYPDARIGFMVADAAPKAAISTAELSARLSGHDLVIVDVDDPRIDTQPSSALPDPAPEDLAYILYTSGTTGTPKGVAITHHNVTQLLASLGPGWAPAAGRVWSPVPFLCVRLLGRGRSSVRFCVVGGWWWCPRRWCVPRRTSTPCWWPNRSVLTPDPFCGSGARRHPSGLESVAVVVGGEACRGRAWWIDGPGSGRVMINVYGPTETTMRASTGSAPLVAGSGAPPIGSPVVGCGVVCAGWVVAAGAGGGGGGVVCGGCGGGVWVCGSGGVDRVAVCGVSVRRRGSAGNTDVSQRGFGALDPWGAVGVCGAR